jgi:hypothetical protein
VSIILFVCVCMHMHYLTVLSERSIRKQNGWTASVVYWLEFLATDPEVWVRFRALPDFLRSGEFGTGSTQPCEYN